MSVRVTAQEKPRRFEINVGRVEVGRVTVWGGRDDGEPCLAEFDACGEGQWEEYGWYRSVKDAARALVRRVYGGGSVDVVERRLAP